jgi:hypothetical protein
MAAVAAKTDPVSLDAIRARARKLLAPDSWSRADLLAHQRDLLRELLRHAVATSPYYREALGPDAPDRPLESLPTLSKPVLMEQFDRIVTDPRRTSANTGSSARQARRACRAFSSSRTPSSPSGSPCPSPRSPGSA